LRGLARFGIALPLLVVLGGCFRYSSTPLASAPTNEDVRVHLSRVALARVPEEFPRGESYLTGRIVGVASDSVVLRVPVSRATGGFGQPNLRQDVYIPRGEIVDVERRHVNAFRTGLTVAAATAAGTALVLAIIEGSGNADEDDGEGPDQMRFPVFSVPFR
jgi:hypothetical protein